MNPLRRVLQLKHVRQCIGRVRRTATEAGMSTAEYAVGTVAAVAFAVVLYKIVRSPAVSSALTSIVNKALHAI
jgi:hypothetical protein